MAGQEAVIDVIGGTKPYLETDLESGTAKVVLDVMKRNAVKRLIVVSAMGVATIRSPTPAGFYEHLLMPHVSSAASCAIRPAWKTKITHGGIDYVIVRPPLLKDADETGQIHEVTGDDKAHTITRGDLAQFLVDQLTNDQYVGQQVTIANK